MQWQFLATRGEATACRDVKEGQVKAYWQTEIASLLLQSAGASWLPADIWLFPYWLQHVDFSWTAAELCRTHHGSHAAQVKLPSTMCKGALKPPPHQGVKPSGMLADIWHDRPAKIHWDVLPSFELTFFFPFYLFYFFVELTQQLQIPISLARIRTLTEKECVVWLPAMPPVNNLSTASSQNIFQGEQLGCETVLFLDAPWHITSITRAQT